MPPRGRPPTRSQSRAKGAVPTPQAQPLATPEGHVQTLAEEPSEAPPLEPQQPQATVQAPVPGTLPAQLQAVNRGGESFNKRQPPWPKQLRTSRIQTIFLGHQLRPRSRTDTLTKHTTRYELNLPSQWSVVSTVAGLPFLLLLLPRIPLKTQAGPLPNRLRPLGPAPLEARRPGIRTKPKERRQEPGRAHSSQRSSIARSLSHGRNHRR